MTQKQVQEMWMKRKLKLGKPYYAELRHEC